MFHFWLLNSIVNFQDFLLVLADKQFLNEGSLWNYCCMAGLVELIESIQRLEPHLCIQWNKKHCLSAAVTTIIRYINLSEIELRHGVLLILTNLYELLTVRRCYTGPKVKFPELYRERTGTGHITCMSCTQGNMLCHGKKFYEILYIKDTSLACYTPKETSSLIFGNCGKFYRKFSPVLHRKCYSNSALSCTKPGIGNLTFGPVLITQVWHVFLDCQYENKMITLF